MLQTRVRVLHPALLLVIVAALFSGAVADAKTVVCISGDNDAFANSAEGYWRQTRPSPPSHISVGTDSLSLRACLSEVADGDTLVIVAHGCAGFFKYGNLRIPGFRGGRGANGTNVVTVSGNRVWPFELPPNFTAEGLDITVVFVSCFSATAPSGARSTVQSMQEAIKDGNSVTGFTGEARVPTPWPILTGGTQAQRNAAYACLINAAPAVPGQTPQGRMRLWLASFRPPGSGVTPNAQSKAEETINADNCPGAGGAVTVKVDYSRPPFSPKPGGLLDPLSVFAGTEDEEPEEISVSACACDEEPIPVIPVTWGSVKALHRH